MNAKFFLASFALLGLRSLNAAGVTWSYSGEVPYQAAIIVWTDETINDINAKADIVYKRNYVLNALTNSTTAVTTGWIVEKCAQLGIINGIKVDIVKPANTTTRVNHNVIYMTDHTGWGFSLLANFDTQGNITEFAINEVTPASIKSEVYGETSLEIKDEDLTPGVSSYAFSRLRDAGAPFITSHAPGTPMIETAPRTETRATIGASNETFVFDITNAVNGFTYHVIATDDLTKPFTRCGVDNLATADGRLAFEIPIKPEEKVRFYRVEVAGSQP